MSNLHQFPDPQRQVGTGDGGGPDLDARLRTVEGDVREIKTRMEEIATKKDISLLQKDLGLLKKDIRIWILSGSTVTLLIIIGWLVNWIIRLSTD